MIALLMVGGNLTLSASASRHKQQLPKHHSQTHYKTGPYAEAVGGKKAPKKQSLPKSHRDRKTGGMVYCKQ